MYDFGIFGDFEINLKEYGFEAGIFFDNPKKSIIPGHFIISDNTNDFRKFSKNKGFILAESKDYKTRRFIAEKGLADGIVNAELYGTRNSVKYPDSGIDDKLMKFMAENKVAYVINLRNIIEKNKIREIMFNIRLAKKFKTPVIMISGAKKPIQIKHASGMISAGVMLGLNKKQAKESLFFSQENIIKRFKK